MAKKFMSMCIGVLALVAAFHLGACQILGLELPRMHEPSGLTHTNLTNNGNVIVMAVDDEQHGIFLLEGSSCIQVYGPIRFKFEGSEGKDPNDLEAVCFDGLNYYAITSHRRLGDNHRPVRRLLRFSIDKKWKTDDYTIPVQTDNLRDLSVQLKDFLRQQGITVPEGQWEDKKHDSLHPYALEIEGLASWGKSLFLGLKWPLYNGKAILLQYDWAENRFTGDVVLLSLGGKGISALAFDASNALLYVAANPPEKAYEGAEPAVAERFRGHSDL
jgi:hypothetical protein